MDYMIWKEVVLAYMRHYHGICLEGLREITENLKWDIPAEISNEHL
jgi:hypothetical protein